MHFPSLPPDHFHGVHFYTDERAWCRTVAGYIRDGLRRHDAIIIVVTPLHHALIVEQLLALDLAVRDLLNTQALQFLDADDTLGLFLRDAGPDGELFQQHVGGMVRAAVEARSPGRVRAYGEMVDLLVQAGRPDHAARLEILWNELATRFDLTLLCGYARQCFPKGIPPSEVLVQHTHLVDIGGGMSAVPVASA